MIATAKHFVYVEQQFWITAPEDGDDVGDLEAAEEAAAPDEVTIVVPPGAVAGEPLVVHRRGNRVCRFAGSGTGAVVTRLARSKRGVFSARSLRPRARLCLEDLRRSLGLNSLKIRSTYRTASETF